MHAIEERLRIERVDLRGSSVHEEVHDLLGFWREVRCAGSQRVDGHVRRARGIQRVQPAVVRDDAGQAEQSEAHPAAAQEFPPAEGEALGR